MNTANKYFKGYDKLLYYRFKINKFKIIIWFLALSLFTIIVPIAYSEMYSNDIELAGINEIMKNPAMIAIVGPNTTDNPTIASMFTQQMLVFSSIAFAIMNIFLVINNTRADEELGRIELVRSFPIGKLSNLHSVTILCLFVNIGFSIFLSVFLIFLRIDSFTLSGSLIYGFSLGLFGLLFSGITIFIVQLSNNPRTCFIISFLVLSISYIFRIIGDISVSIFSFITPLGLVTKTEAYVNNYWWPNLILIFLYLIFIFIGYYLYKIRDLNSGVLDHKQFLPKKSFKYKSIFNFNINIQIVAIITWGISILGLSYIYGSVFGDLQLFFDDNEFIQRMLPSSNDMDFAEQFMPVIFSILSIVSSLAAISIFYKLKSEEVNSRMDLILTNGIERKNVYISFLLTSLSIALLYILLAILGLWIGIINSMDSPITLITVFKSGIIYFPAMAFVISISGLFFGVNLKYTNLSWIIMGYSFFIVYFGGLIDIHDFFKYLTPFGYIPKYPVEDINIITSMILIFISIIFSLIGLKKYQDRDLN